MRVLIAPQEFKGTLTARQAADAVAKGLRDSLAGIEIDTLPLADGGPGTLDALVQSTGGRYMESAVHDPLGRPLRARWAILGGGLTGAIEMATASGLVLLQPEERDPRVTSSFGTGELVLAALEQNVREIIVGAGGSATNDGGAGMAQALGARFVDEGGRDLAPGGSELIRLERIDVSAFDSRVGRTSMVVATDVTNPLCGENGASIVYGPQKGASRRVAQELDRALERYAQIIKRDLARDVADIPGSGAAGGLVAGLIAFCDATVRSGFEVIAEAVRLDDRIAKASTVITGEGRIDRQTPFGKTPSGVASACRRLGVSVIAVAGQVADPEAAALFDATFDLASIAPSPESAISDASEYLERLAREHVAPWLLRQV
jgi:glycerate kinase